MAIPLLSAFSLTLRPYRTKYHPYIVKTATEVFSMLKILIGFKVSPTYAVHAN